MLQPIIVIYRRGKFVYNHWGYTSIYQPLSYPVDPWYLGVELSLITTKHTIPHGTKHRLKNKEFSLKMHQNFDNIEYFSWIIRDKTMADKLMYIPMDDTQNYPFFKLILVVETFQHST